MRVRTLDSKPGNAAAGSGRRLDFEEQMPRGNTHSDTSRTADFESAQAVINGAEPQHSEENSDADAPVRDVSSHFNAAWAHFEAASPRARIIATIAATMLDAVASGDLEAARVAHDAVGRLLGSARDPGDRGSVVEIASRRRDRDPRR